MCYWVMPPPENRPTEYGRPMLMTYSVSQEHYLSQDALNEMVCALFKKMYSNVETDDYTLLQKKCAEFYKGEPDAVKFTDFYCEGVTYLDKLKVSLFFFRSKTVLAGSLEVA